MDWWIAFLLSAGARIIAGMGWQPGCGLGRELQGPSSCLRLSSNDGSSGVGHKKGRWEGGAWWESAFDDALQSARSTQADAKVRGSVEHMPPSGSSSESSDSSDEDADADEGQVERRLAKRWAQSRCSGKMARIQQMEKQNATTATMMTTTAAVRVEKKERALVEAALPPPPMEALVDDPTAGLDWWGKKRFTWGGLLSETDSRRRLDESSSSLQGHHRSPSRQQRRGFSEALQEEVFHAAEQSKSSGRKGLGRRGQQQQLSAEGALKTGTFSGTHIKFAEESPEDGKRGAREAAAGEIDQSAKERAGGMLEKLVVKWRKADVRSMPFKKVRRVVVNRLGKQSGVQVDKEARAAWSRWLRKYIRKTLSGKGVCSLEEGVVYIRQST